MRLSPDAGQDTLRHFVGGYPGDGYDARTFGVLELPVGSLLADLLADLLPALLLQDPDHLPYLHPKARYGRAVT
jgi:hypothetical protein